MPFSQRIGRSRDASGAFAVLYGSADEIRGRNYLIILCQRPTSRNNLDLAGHFRHSGRKLGRQAFLPK
jgi:hypothetical protein